MNGIAQYFEEVAGANATAQSKNLAIYGWQSMPS
jgi:hypothetical protein